MSNLIDKKKATIEEITDSKSLKKMKTPELERILQTLLCDMSDNDTTVNTIIAELLKRGVSKEEINQSVKDDKGKEKIKKAFDVLGIDLSLEFISKGRGATKMIGELDKAGKNVKTANGWVPVKGNEHLVKEQHKTEATDNIYDDSDPDYTKWSTKTLWAKYGHLASLSKRNPLNELGSKLLKDYGLELQKRQDKETGHNENGTMTPGKEEKPTNNSGVQENKTVHQEEPNYSTEQLAIQKELDERIAMYKRGGVSDIEIEKLGAIKQLRNKLAAHGQPDIQTQEVKKSFEALGIK